MCINQNITTTHQRGCHAKYSTWKRNRQLRVRDCPGRGDAPELPELFRNRPSAPAEDFARARLPRRWPGASSAMRGGPSSSWGGTSAASTASCGFHGDVACNERVMRLENRDGMAGRRRPAGRPCPKNMKRARKMENARKT